MKSLQLVILFALTLTACSVQKKDSAPPPPAPAEPAAVVPNEFVFAGDQAVVRKYLSSMGVNATIQPIAKGVPAFQVRYQGSTPMATLLDGLRSVVEYAEPNYQVKADSSLDRYTWPNDRLFFKQWAINNIGQSPPYGLPGTEGADMDVLKAWALTKGTKEPIVAVLDTGVDYTHPDLKENIWVNEKESPDKGGVAGKDDDGNGLIDDVYGYDFYSGGRTDNKFGVPGDPDPMDEDGHGTHCAGSIGALANNAQGVAGINQSVRIMALRFLGSGGGSTVDAVRAIYYAIEKKANVMSNSWGGGGDSKLLRDAIADAGKAGILFVVAAGNDGKNIDVSPAYPAAYDKDSRGSALKNVLTVGASDNQDNPADFSNYGHDKVHVFAPGVHIVSTFPVKKAANRPYAVMSGTSMATPYVAGIAALMMARTPGLKNQPSQVKDILMQTVDVKDSLLGKATSNGRVNAAKAVEAKAQNPTKSQWVTKAHSIRERGFQKDLVDIRHEIKVPGAKALRVHFDFLEVQRPFDSVYLYDRHLRLITEVEDTATRDHWSTVVPGDTVHVRFTNALVKQVQMGLSAPQSSEATCLNLGAEEIIQVGSEYRCMTDSEDSSGSKTYSTFNSEGFSVDRIEYIPAEGEKK